MRYENDLIILTLLKSKKGISKKENRQIESIEISYPEWSREFEGLRNYLCSRGYIDRVDVNPNLPIQDEYGGSIVYKDGEKFDYYTNNKGFKALRRKVFPSSIGRRKEDAKDRRITRIVAIAGLILAAVSILMQIAS